MGVFCCLPQELPSGACWARLWPSSSLGASPLRVPPAPSPLGHTHWQVCQEASLALEAAWEGGAARGQRGCPLLCPEEEPPHTRTFALPEMGPCPLPQGQLPSPALSPTPSPPPCWPSR